MLGRRYNRAKKAQNDGGAGVSKTTVAQIDPRLSTAEKLAAKHGVSPATVKRAGQYAEAVATVEKPVPGFSQAIEAPRLYQRSGEECKVLSGFRALSDFVRAQLALLVKPLIEARAKANHLANAGDKVSEAASQKSDAPVEKLRTDDEIAKMAGVTG